MSEQIKVKDEPVDPEYDRILAEMKPDPDEIPDGYFDDIVNELDGFIDNVNEQLEDRKLIIPPPADAEIVPRAEAASDSSSDSDDAVDMQLCRARIKELKQLLKYGKQKKRKRHSYSHDRSPSRRRKQSPSRHSRNKGRSRKRSRSSNDRHRHRSKDDSAERGVIQPPKVRKIKEEQAEEQVVGGDDVDKVVEETQETRRERIIKMCVTFIKTFVKPGERPIKTRFFYTPSVIPISGVDHLLEYRSPLNHITNVQFKFNSLSAYVDIQQFGLKTFTDPVTNVSKEIGFDVPQLMDKLSINELPKALKPEQTSSTLSKDGKFHTPFFTDVATQTEAMSCTSCIKRKLKTFAERGVMAVPMRGYKAVQTESEQELPIMNTISLLNSSQLLALNDFSELIRAPAVFLHDVCRLREKLVEIFNVSQRSSMMTTNVAQTGTIQRSTVQQERSLLVRNTQSFNTPMQAQSQNQYTINNQASISHVSQPHYSGSTRHQQNAHQFFNMGTSTPQNHAFPTQSAHTNMNMQYQFQSQNEQNQQHYPQHNMSMTSQYHTPQPVCPPNVRRDDPRHRGKEIDISNAPPPPRSNDPPKTPTFGRGPRNLKSTRSSPEASTSGARQQSNFLEPIALTSKNPPKSSTQRSREYRERKKLSQPAKLPPKSQSQRTQEYKERKKLRILHQKIQENEIISR